MGNRKRSQFLHTSVNLVKEMNAWERLLTRVDEKAFTGDRKKRVSVQPVKERERSTVKRDVD